MSDFTKQQAHEINKLLERPPHRYARYKPESFLLHFIHVEALLRVVGRYYRQRENRRSVEKFEPLRLDSVTRASAFFRVRVSATRLSSLLDSKLTHRGKKSARNLRNGLGHNWDANDASEVINRYSSLDKLLEGVVDAIRKRTAGITR